MPLHADLAAIDAEPAWSMADKGRAACQLVRAHTQARAEIISFVDGQVLAAVAVQTWWHHSQRAHRHVLLCRLLRPSLLFHHGAFQS